MRIHTYSILSIIPEREDYIPVDNLYSQKDIKCKIADSFYFLKLAIPLQPLRLLCVRQCYYCMRKNLLYIGVNIKILIPINLTSMVGGPVCFLFV